MLLFTASVPQNIITDRKQQGRILSPKTAESAILTVVLLTNDCTYNPCNPRHITVSTRHEPYLISNIDDANHVLQVRLHRDQEALDMLAANTPYMVACIRKGA
jgi:hypothetical protein